jgi:hypothetical protein
MAEFFAKPSIMKRRSATAIQRGFVDVHGSHAIAYSTVTKYPRSASFEVKGTGSDEGPGDNGINGTGSNFSCAWDIPLCISLPDCFDGTLTENNGASARDGIAQLWEQEIALVPKTSQRRRNEYVLKNQINCSKLSFQ